jgi:hypothetical protein
VPCRDTIALIVTALLGIGSFAVQGKLSKDAEAAQRESELAQMSVRRCGWLRRSSWTECGCRCVAPAHPDWFRLSCVRGDGARCR